MKISRRKIAILIAMAVALSVVWVGARAEATDAPAPADISALLQSAQHQFGTGNYPGAIATLGTVITQNPLSAEAFYWMGRCYYEIHDFDNAVAHAEKSVALEPKNSMFQDQLGRAYGAKAEHDHSFFLARKVKKQFVQAVQLDPSNIAARKDLEEFCLLAPWIVGGNIDEARVQADEIAKLDPVEGHVARAALDVEGLKKPELAETEYRAILAAKPNNLDAYFEAAAFFRRQNKFSDMNSAIDAAAQVNPNDPRLSFYHGVGLVAAGSNLDRGEQYLKSYLASTPDRSDWPSHAGAREWLGQLYEKQGKPAEAAEQYRAALQLEPGSKSARERLAKLEKPR